ncbi:DUF4097 family beta strand repeat-containing protein [Actinomadura fulvescens]|uniref:DUF4097 family beta strand repeat-containing protein n=1 Tax=Actinomadura fulvescens TaxID=46160 RepID=UPI0031E13AA6
MLTAIVVVLPTGVATLGRLLERTERATETVPGPIRTLEIDAGAATVAVGAGTTGGVRVHSTLTWSVTKPKVIRSVQAGTLKIRVVCAGEVDPFGGFGCTADLDLQVPPEVSVRVQATSGQVAIRDLSGDVGVYGTSGRVELAHLRGKVVAETNSGSIEGRAMASPEVDADVRSGSIEVSFADPPRKVSVRTGSGAATVTVPRGTHYRVDGGTGSGEREVDGALRDDAATRVISATTGSGSVRIGYPATR